MASPTEFTRVTGENSASPTITFVGWDPAVPGLNSCLVPGSREFLAAHEAAHALIAFYRGIKIFEIGMTPEGGHILTEAVPLTSITNNPRSKKTWQATLALGIAVDFYVAGSLAAPETSCIEQPLIADTDFADIYTSVSIAYPLVHLAISPPC